jgi:hypothetical protein
MLSEHEMAMAFLQTTEGRAYMDREFGSTPAEAMAKLKERNPDYDHHPQPAGGLKPGPVLHEATCDCGKPVWLVEINQDGMVYTHLARS